MKNEVINISGVECYEKDGTAYLKLDTVARGLGFTRIAESGNEVVRWERVEKYLNDLGVPTCGHDDFIPENIFYRLAMKAKNEAAEAFQAKIADEVIPSIRKHGVYMVDEVMDRMIADPDFGIKLLLELKEERERRKQLEEEKRQAQPKVDYFDELVDRNLLTNFRDTAKELGVKERIFIRFLEDYNYIYRDTKKRIKPVAARVQEGIFQIKDIKSEHSSWAGNQTLITPKGKSTFQLLLPQWLAKQSSIMVSHK